MIMKAFVALVVLAVIFSGAQGEQMLGNCTMKVYRRKGKTCVTSFIHALQKNPTSNCSAEMNVCFDCITESVTYCDPTTPKAPFKSSLQTLFTKDLLCDRAGLQIDPNVTLPTPQNGTLCKGIKTLQQFIDKRNACADKIVKMWQANKADKETCSEYVNTKACQIKVYKTHICNATEVFMFIDDGIGNNFNPFCPNGVDPTNTSLMTRPSHGLLFLLLLAALVNSFKF